jgi:hypothetical protein
MQFTLPDDALGYVYSLSREGKQKLCGLVAKLLMVLFVKIELIRPRGQEGSLLISSMFINKGDTSSMFQDYLLSVLSYLLAFIFFCFCFH